MVGLSFGLLSFHWTFSWAFEFYLTTLFEGVLFSLELLAAILVFVSCGFSGARDSWSR